MELEKAYEFNDVLIRPLNSDVSSRDDVDISVELSDDLILKFPLIASPMVGVVDGNFAHLLSQLGGMAIMHRFYNRRENLFRDITENIKEGDYYGISIRIGEKSIEEYFSYSPNVILIDTANGYTTSLLKYCEEVKKKIEKENMDILLMAGNVVTLNGCLALRDSGCDLIRVGIGGGSLCSTRNQTGIGIPNITALQRCSVGGGWGFKIVTDGGIENSGDFVKAIVAGADLGMSGRLYAECYESPNEGTIYGMASRTNMENTKTTIKSVEGFDMIIKKKHSLEQFVREFGYGIKSAGTYLNARNLLQISLNGTFVEVSNYAIKKDI